MILFLLRRLWFGWRRIGRLVGDNGRVGLLLSLFGWCRGCLGPGFVGRILSISLNLLGFLWGVLLFEGVGARWGLRASWVV